MKFFESKYYAHFTQPLIRDMSVPHVKTNDDRRGPFIRDHMYIASKSQYGMAGGVLGCYCIRMPLMKGYKLNRKHIEETWTKVTDLTLPKTRYRLDIDLDTLDDMFQTVYFHEESEFFVLLTGQRVDDISYNEFTTLGLHAPFGIDIHAGMTTLMTNGDIYFVEVTPVPTMGVLVSSSSGYTIKHRNLECHDIDFDTMYVDGFEEVSDTIVECLQEKDSSGLIILHGEPGTGKTNFIRWLSGKSKRDMVFIPPDMVSSLASPTFVKFLLDNVGLTFIVEDAESSLSPRQGSEKSIVSSILNLTDGLLGDILKCQFLCTFNTELTNIDSALLRPGRLLVRHEFTNLDVATANRYLKSIDSSITVTEPTSLAVLTNLDNLPVENEVIKKTSFGFNSTH